MTAKPAGIGLGLNIVKALTEHLGIGLNIESSPETGTTVCLKFKVAAPPLPLH